MFQSPRNRVNISNKPTELAAFLKANEFQSPRNRVNISNKVRRMRTDQLELGFNPLEIGSTFQIDPVLPGPPQPRRRFNPLEIGSTFQMFFRPTNHWVRHAFQSPRNRVNISNEALCITISYKAALRFNPLEIGSTFQMQAKVGGRRHAKV